MTTRWEASEEQEFARFGWRGVVRLILRIVPIGIVVYGGLLVLLLVRLVEAPLFRTHRPVTPWITLGVCKFTLFVMGIRLRRTGRPMGVDGAMVANHASWLDIFVLNALDRIYFVAKSEVEGWAGIGWLARATGTAFVERRARAAGRQKNLFMERLESGHRLLFFPEGTSTDGRRVLPFKSTLFAAFFEEPYRQHLSIQPVSVVYHAPRGQDPRFFGWWGDSDFAPHFLCVLSAPSGGAVDVVFHEPLAVAEFESRKELAAAAQKAVAEGFNAHVSEH